MGPGLAGRFGALRVSFDASGALCGESTVLLPSPFPPLVLSSISPSSFSASGFDGKVKGVLASESVFVALLASASGEESYLVLVVEETGCAGVVAGDGLGFVDTAGVRTSLLAPYKLHQLVPVPYITAIN